ncbi:MAG TPA: ATP-binding cassette domain-containing protein [Thermoleophilaceae bacterium]|jgi:ABC-2 type transport system ATP-binding protein
MSLAIEASGLTKKYGGDVQALAGLDLAVEAGTVHALLGPNGAGKSTTVRILTTLARPDSGSARVAGFDVLRQPERVRAVIGVVGQKSGVDVESTGRENILLHAKLHGLRDGRERADELLNQFDLADAADRIVKTWSGGMSRRLDVAMGLIHRPQVLFLDEPTTGLDPEVRARLWDQIRSLSRDGGLTILLTTHYLEEADELAATISIADAGRVVVEGTPAELKSELRGDSVHIELADAGANGNAVHALAQVSGLCDVSADGTVLNARADDAARAVPLVLAALEDAGAPVASVTVARPSLDDVYLRHTGHSYQEGSSR